MAPIDRRNFIKISSEAGVLTALWPSLIQKALSVDAHNKSGSIEDVKHIVILMQENRSFDHYFGTMKGVRGFGDRFPIPLESGERVFDQTDGEKIIRPYHADKNSSNAALISGTPHNFPDAQAAWNQGKFGQWPLFKTPYSMAYYTRAEIPFQYALAEAFTLSDAYHCSVMGGTDPNRIVFFSGSNFDPEKRAQGINCTDLDSEPTNLRCWLKGDIYRDDYAPVDNYKGNAFQWDTIPEVLEEAGVTWRIFQDPNDNWTGAMHGCLAFEGFRNAKPGSPIFENGMRKWTLEDLKSQVMDGSLPQVSWVLPSQDESEHPNAPSSPYRGADFTHQVLEALTANPETWSKTVFFLTFDENDGLFDHLPPPAIPSYNNDKTLAGKSTLDLSGMYFHNNRGIGPFDNPFHEGEIKEGEKIPQKTYQDPRDTISGNLRPFGLGPRVPMYIVSPWSKGGWVHSEVADHTSVGQFIEKRFKVRIPSISPWHRAISSDLSSAFDFVKPNDATFPTLPKTAHFSKLDEASKLLPKAVPPKEPGSLFQEKGYRPSRALDYQLHTEMVYLNDTSVQIVFKNEGNLGVVFHVYDLNHLDRIPRRFTVEAGKSISDVWTMMKNEGNYDLEVFGPNGYFHKWQGSRKSYNLLDEIEFDRDRGQLKWTIKNESSQSVQIHVEDNAYGYPNTQINSLKPNATRSKQWSLEKSGHWYDFTVTSDSGFLHRFAGRLETGKDSISDPAMATEI